MTEAGETNGWLLILDPGKLDDEKHNTNTDTEQYDSLDLNKDKECLFRIHINTLDRFSDNKDCIYTISAPKKITVTHSFLALPERDKKCQTEILEAC